MTDAAFNALDTHAIYDQIVARWGAGLDTMEIALDVRSTLQAAGHRSLPSLDEAQAHAHNVIAFHRDTARAARRQKVTRPAQVSSFHAAGGSAP